MTYSLNEVEATAKRATRGAGYTWGMAEEAAKATRWLCAQGVDGIAELVGLLELELAASYSQHSPVVSGDEWTGDKTLCPLATGAYLSDVGGPLPLGVIRIQHVARPMLLLPFVANIARQQGQTVTLAFSGVSAATDGTRLSLDNHVIDLADHVEITLGGVLENPRSLMSRAAPHPDSWARLQRFAHRTYAPATEESRLLGAGAGLSDND